MLQRRFGTLTGHGELTKRTAGLRASGPIYIGRLIPPAPRIDFLLTAKRDTAAAKRFLRKAIEASGNATPRVINVDKNPAYPAAVDALKDEGVIPRRVALRQCKYLNNGIEMV